MQNHMKLECNEKELKNIDKIGITKLVTNDFLLKKGFAVLNKMSEGKNKDNIRDMLLLACDYVCSECDEIGMSNEFLFGFHTEEFNITPETIEKEISDYLENKNSVFYNEIELDESCLTSREITDDDIKQKEECLYKCYKYIFGLENGNEKEILMRCLFMAYDNHISCFSNQ